MNYNLGYKRRQPWKSETIPGGTLIYKMSSPGKTESHQIMPLVQDETMLEISLHYQMMPLTDETTLEIP
jgi:hypothetical protein